jgi:SanA protein
LTLSLLLISGVLLLGLPRIFTGIYASKRIHTIEESPSAPVAIVFGAGLNRDGSPTSVLRHRVTTAANLYFAGKVKKLLMSGDNRTLEYNEPASMYEYAVNLGVPAEDIVLDYAGRRTYDTCYRANYIFGVDKAILVTQNFHLPRALFICNSLNVESTGVSADLRDYRRLALLSWNIREIPASLMALIDVWFRHPLPVLGEKEPIFTSVNQD